MPVNRCVVVLLGLLACGGCAKPKSTDELMSDLQGGQERERIIAVRTLPERKEDAAKVVPALIAALKDKGDDVRWSAAIGLGNFGEEAKDAIPALQIATARPRRPGPRSRPRRAVRALIRPS